MQSAKLELIKMIADIQSKKLLDKVRQFLKETETSGSHFKFTELKVFTSIKANIFS